MNCVLLANAIDRNHGAPLTGYNLYTLKQVAENASKIWLFVRDKNQKDKYEKEQEAIFRK